MRVFVCIWVVIVGGGVCYTHDTRCVCSEEGYGRRERVSGSRAPHHVMVSSRRSILLITDTHSFNKFSDFYLVDETGTTKEAQSLF